MTRAMVANIAQQTCTLSNDPTQTTLRIGERTIYFLIRKTILLLSVIMTFRCTHAGYRNAQSVI